ncbi:unnamed protein product [Caenorhabditis bovis]|uniref:Uncharacterized protein n=1 Tax=Caenorhabditis bovis TaxID=2654633 RepID=A0A8S1EIK4_9PELO|nr:unnamed protein product [Caenorhabditis bovis]
MSEENLTTIAPHRGFNQKARDILIGPEDMPNGVYFKGMPFKSSSEFDLRKKIQSSFKKGSNNSSPKSQSSTHLIPEHPVFDTIGEESKVKKHLKLSEIGKARSCAELKSDKRLIRTFQEDNILKMPSIDSDIGLVGPMPEIDSLCIGFEGLGKSVIYSADTKQPNKNKEVKKWLNKNNNQ